MKALLALNESTTAEIIADVLQIDPEQAEEIAGQMRLSEILDMVQHIKQNSMGEANEIIKPYLAELLSGTGASGGTANSNLAKTTITPKDPEAQSLAGKKNDEEQEAETGQKVGKGTVTFVDDQGNEEKVVQATSGTRRRMANQSIAGYGGIA